MADMTAVASRTSTQPDLILDVSDLHVEFATPQGTLHAVNGVSLTLGRGETLAILGESGCGKSVMMLAVMGLVRSPPGRVQARHIRIGQTDLLSASPASIRALRGQRVAMIFQDPFTSLDPTKTVGQQIGEVFRVHRGATHREARRQAIRLMDRVRIPSAGRRVDDYPHQFSGGMCQRVMIASAIALDPDLLIADEPTTALDVTVQAQIMELLDGLRCEIGMSVVIITHDVRLAAEFAERAIVMYAGRVVESGSMRATYARPRHPYTIGLLRSLPDIESSDTRLKPVPGTPPVMMRLPAGCPFSPRCDWKRDRCTQETPSLRPLDIDHVVACHFAEEIINA